MNVLKAIAVAAVWVFAIWMIYTTCAVPLRCNAIEDQVERSMLATADASADPLILNVRARNNLARLRPCLEGCSSVNRMMLAAYDLRILHRYADALSLYEQAMRIDRRSELYLNLGLTEIEAGRPDAGVEHLFTACVYNPDLINEVSAYHDVVKNRVDLYQIHIANLQRKANR